MRDAPFRACKNSITSAAFTVQARPLSHSFFIFNGGPYAAAVYADGSLVGPPSLYPGQTAPAQPGEIILLYANGLGPTSSQIVSGSLIQSGTLPTLPVIKIGGLTAEVQFAGLVLPGEFPSFSSTSSYQFPRRMAIMRSQRPITG